MLITNDVPGYRIDRIVGSQLGASFKSLADGELRGLTKTLAESRNQAMESLIEQAHAHGGNAVLAMRFDVTEAA